MRCSLCFGFVVLLSVVCGSPECSKYDFSCENGQCVDGALWCDSSKDCTDGSDEKYCKKSGIFNANPNKCPPAYFKCNDGPCIPMKGRCDDYDNCEDSSDEKNCQEHHSSPQSVGTSSLSKPSSLPLEIKTTAANPFTTSQPPLKYEETSARHFSNSPATKQHPFEMEYSNLHPDYSQQRMAARNWLLSQRRNDFGWGDDTPRAITALYLSDVQQSIERDESDMLMVKQLEVLLSLDMARNGTKAIKLTDLALYINALQASCKDPKNFYGEDLVSTLRNGVDAAQRETVFVNPSVYLTLCMNNATTYEDTRKLHDIFLTRNAAMGRIDLQALALITGMCIFRNTAYLKPPMFDGIKKQFLDRMTTNGFPGNVYEASLLGQALQELKVVKPGLLELILEEQHKDGSFGGILATYLVLPLLAGKSFLQMNDHCAQRQATGLAPIEVLRNSKRRKMHVQYALNYGNPPEVTQTIQMQVAEGISFLDVMRLAQEINPKYRFMLDVNRDAPVVYSIGGIPNDAEKGKFWTLHLASSNSRLKADAGRFAPFSGNIKELIAHAGDEFVFWMRSL